MANLSEAEKVKNLLDALRAVSCFRKFPKYGLHVGIEISAAFDIYQALRAFDEPKGGAVKP